jgi:putative ABC transport system permease protein
MLPHLRPALARVRELFRRRSRLAAEQSEEFSFHIEMETAENVRRGMTGAEARRAALLRFGGAQRFLEATDDARGVVALDNLARDTRFAFRRLRRAPGFSAGVVATLGIGIGAAVGIGTIVYDVLLRDLPYPKPDQLARVGFVADGISTAGDLLSPATYFHFAKSARSFDELGAYYTSDDFTVTDGDAPERVSVAMLTPNLFSLLGVHPLLGQLFETRDTSWTDGSGRIPILIAENFWRRRYGGDSSVIGRRIDINRGERIVVGVLPRSFAFPASSVDIYYPATVPVMHPQLALGYYTVIGRLRDGVTATSAARELNRLLPRISERFSAITPDVLQRSRARISVTPLHAAIVAPVRAQLVLLGILVAIVLLIASTNVANLFLLRAERASQEIAIALSLGATRIALAQRFVMEGVVLGLASTIIALPVAALALTTKFGFTEREIPRLHEVSFTSQTLALLLACAGLIGALVGLIALTRADSTGVYDRLRSSRSTSTGGWRRVQSGLVAIQVAITLMLLVAGALLGRSFSNLRNARIGFDPEHALTFQVSLPWNGYTSYAEQAAFHAKLTDRLAALPGVTSVGVALYLPLASRGAPVLEAQLQAGNGDGRPMVAAAGNMASADYFHTMGIPLRAGRSFHSGDLRGAPAVVVSEGVARSLFGNTNAVGRRIAGRVYAGARLTAFTIVGVVGDVPWGRIEDGDVPMVYFPLLRDGDGLPPDSNPVRHRPTEVQYVMRGTRLPTAATIQNIVKELDHRVPAANVRRVTSLVDDATARVRLTMLLIAVAGGSALLLAVIGVYSVVSYAASGRLREFGIRLALGAAPAQLGAMILGEGLRLVGAGTAVGIVAALGATRFLRSLLYQVQPTSAAEFGLATALLVMVTSIATLLPARRAARTHPAVVLRGE